MLHSGYDQIGASCNRGCICGKCVVSAFRKNTLKWQADRAFLIEDRHSRGRRVLLIKISSSFHLGENLVG